MTDIPPVPPSVVPPAGSGLERLQARTVAYWYVMDLIGAVILGGLLFGGHWCVRDLAEQWLWLANPVALTLGSIVLLQALVGPPLSFRFWRYGFAHDLLHMRYGILWREERIVPVRRMQHVDLMRGPIERLFGLATLVVHTAGNEGSAFRVPGLLPEQAQRLRDQILRARGDDVV